MIVNIYGTSNTGKTTTMVEVIKRLKKANLRVAAIKHTNGKFQIDSPGKDSYKLQEAGADTTVLSTGLETDFIIKDVLKLEAILDILYILEKVDVVIVEGYKEFHLNRRVLIMRFKPDEVDLENIVDEVKENIKINKALQTLPGLDCGKCGYNNCPEFAQVIAQGKKVAGDCPEQDEFEIKISINGEQLILNKFTSEITKNTILGLLESLKHSGKTKDVQIEINSRE